MKDEALEKIWNVRESISEQCEFDSRQLVKYLQRRSSKRKSRLKSEYQRENTEDSSQ